MIGNNNNTMRESENVVKIIIVNDTFLVIDKSFNAEIEK